MAWPLARQVNSVVQLEIGAHDGGGLKAEPSARVNISIVPGTPMPPIFEQLQYVFSVPEDVALGTSVGIVRAHNPPGIICHYTRLAPYPDSPDTKHSGSNSQHLSGHVQALCFILSHVNISLVPSSFSANTCPAPYSFEGHRSEHQ